MYVKKTVEIPVYTVVTISKELLCIILVLF
jgi:hypothetical protein